MKPVQYFLKQFLNGGDYFYIHRDEFRPNRKRSPHWHNYCEIFCIESGSGIHLINGREFRLTPGMVCLIRKEDTHTLYSRNHMQIINIAFPGTSLEILRRYPRENPSLREDRLICRLEPSRLKEFSSCSLALSRSSHSQLDLEDFLLRLLILIRGNSGPRPSVTEEIPECLRRFTAFLRCPENLVKNVSELAELSGVSREHLSREARRVFGRTAIKMINETRIEHACFQLKMTSLSIKEITRNCGYESPGQFYSIFRREMEMTPLEYRKFRP